jgi:hypothetical protein
MIEVEGPDGTVYEFPPNTPPAKIKEAMAKAYGAPKEPAKPKGDANRWTAGQSAIQGATFGLADEIVDPLVAGVGYIGKNLFGDGTTYADEFRRVREQGRADMEAYESQNPGKATAAKIAGGVALGGALGKGSNAAATTVAGGGAAPTGGLTMAGRIGTSLPARVAESAIEAGAYGGLQAFGEASGTPNERLDEALTGAAAGAVTGGALTGGLAALKGATSGITSAIRGRTDPQGYAARKVAQSIERTGTPLRSVYDRLDDLGDDARIADLGENTRDLLRVSNNQAGAGREAIEQFASDRVGDSRSRISDGLRSATGKNPSDFYATLDALEASYRAKAAPAYKAAYSQPIDYSDFALDDLAKRIPARAWAKANALMQAEGYTPRQLLAKVADDGSVTFNRVPDVKQWDYVQRGLREIAEGTDGAGAFGKQTDYGRAILNLRKELLKTLDAKVPAFGTARKIAGDAISMRQAMDTGRDLVGVGGEEARRAVAKLKGPDAEAARMGYLKALQDQFLKGRDGSDRVAAVWTPRQREVFGVLFPGQKFDDFAKAMADEAKKLKTARAVTGNSTTTRQLAQADEGGIDVDFAASAATSGLTSAAIQAMARYARKLGGLTERSSSEMGRLLLARKQDLPSVLKEIEAAQRKIASSQFRDGLLPLLGGRVGQLTGGAVTANQQQP